MRVVLRGVLEIITKGWRTSPAGYGYLLCYMYGFGGLDLQWPGHMIDEIFTFRAHRNESRMCRLDIY